MWFFGKQKRSAVITQSETSETLLQLMGLSPKLPYGITTEQAFEVPAVWAAVNFLSGTIAGLPLQVFQKNKDGRKKVSGGVSETFSKFANDSCSSFQWRYDMFSTGVLYGGRSVTYIDRGKNGQIRLFPVIGAQCELLGDGTKRYFQTLKGGGKKYFAAKDVIDITFCLKPDLVTHRGPLTAGSRAIAMAFHANNYAAQLYANNGMPSYVMQGPFDSKKTATHAAEDISQAAKKIAKDGGNVLVMPLGHELKALGGDPKAMQLPEMMAASIPQVARIFQLPPVFLQDLTHGTFSNTEQQDLQLVKHTVKRWCEQLEAEINLKIFGRGSNRYVEFNLDGLMRGDFMSTMNGNAVAIQSGQVTPNETRKRRNLKALEGGDDLFIQGATVPLSSQVNKGADDAEK